MSCTIFNDDICDVAWPGHGELEEEKETWQMAGMCACACACACACVRVHRVHVWCMCACACACVYVHEFVCVSDVVWNVR